MINQQDLFIMDLDMLNEDLYRMGNASSANFSEQRGLVDCQVVDRGGVPTDLANGNGFSAFNRITAVTKRPGRHVWKIKSGSRLPPDTRLVADRTNPGHYMFAPAFDMPFQKDRTAEAIEDEDKQLVAFDHLERLERIIPNLEAQLEEPPLQQPADLRWTAPHKRGRLNAESRIVSSEWDRCGRVPR